MRRRRLAKEVEQISEDGPYSDDNFAYGYTPWASWLKVGTRSLAMRGNLHVSAHARQARCSQHRLLRSRHPSKIVVSFCDLGIHRTSPQCHVQKHGRGRHQPLQSYLTRGLSTCPCTHRCATGRCLSTRMFAQRCKRRLGSPCLARLTSPVDRQAAAAAAPPPLTQIAPGMNTAGGLLVVPRRHQLLRRGSDAPMWCGAAAAAAWCCLRR